MCRLLFVCLALSPAAAFADNPKHRFMHIYAPVDEDKYGTDIANVAGMGLFYFFDPEWKPEDLRIRVRIYRPVKDDFEVFLEDDAQIGPPLGGDPATLQWGMNLKVTKAPTPGKYLYRVDCFDTTGEAEKLLASNAVFITFVGDAPNKKQLPQADKTDGASTVRPRHARMHHASRTTRRFVSRID